MMNKQYLVTAAVFISTIGLIYLYNNADNTPEKSEYQLLAVADHEKLASGQFDHQMVLKEPIENSIFNSTTNTTSANTSSSRSILAPAISAVAIAKFLNGNLPTTTPSGNTSVPTLLSQTGAFSNLASLTPSPGLIPYDMIEPFWSDGADKKRWMAIPNDGTYNTAEEQIQFSQDNAWNFPKGAVLIKHFEFPGNRLETRFEVKGDDDVYYYLTYKWNATQTDATLLDESVDENIVVNGVTQSWHYPSRNECASCHFPQNGSVLGPKTRNLNKSITYPSSGVTMNQLVNFSELGILTENITNTNATSYPAVAAKNDLSASLEDRARSYIDVNCSSCHNPTVDNIAMFDARFSTPLAIQNIIYGDVIYDEGLNNPKVIIPQDVSNSMAHFRMNSTQTGIEMPPIAKDVVDTQGVQLIADWISSLTPATTSPPVAAFSASTTNGSAPLAVNFDASASTDADNDTLTYAWDFGDGNTAQGETTTHVYTNSGSFTAILSVSDGQFSDQEITTIIVNNSNPGGDTVSFTDSTTLIGQDNFSGLAMGVIDMNGDGKDDIVQFNSARNLRIQYQNGNNQNFTTYDYGQVSTKNQWGTAIADFDQNGFNDIMSGGAYDNLKIIKNNNGSDSFSLTTLPDANIFLQGANFADINNDGWADIFACHDDAESRAYSNNQDGTFSFDADLISTETDPISDNSGNYASMWMDYDNDGDLDLYISKCRGGVTSSSDPRRINMLWQNDGNNNFTEVAGQANLKIGEQTWLSDFGDIDNDGDLDAIIINHGAGPNLMRNNGNGTFTEITSGSGLLPTLEPQDFYGIQGFFKDFNNDGYIDLMVSGDNHYIFYNNGDGTFQNATNPFNSNQIQSFSVGDINHDGFLDIYAGYANGLNSPSSTKDRIWLNEGNSNNYLNIQLKGTQSNINGIGARVELYGTWGKQIRDVRSGEGYGLVNSYTQHFGIGVNTQVDKVVVRWPSGIVDEILNPNINQFLKINENEELRDNIALNKPTQQSTTAYSGIASRAVDGNTNGSYSARSTTHTANVANSWWKVDLGDTYSLSTIKIFNRTDNCCTQRLDQAKVYVSITNSTDPADYQEIGVLNSSDQQNFHNLEATGRYIMIYKETASVLSLTEVEVYGELTVTNVTDIAVSPEIAILIEGETQQLTATVTPIDADETSVTWSSSNSAVATVNSNGLVTSLAEGNTTITATTTDGSFTASSTIVVEGSGGCILSNVALTATATQSSTYGNGEASFAIDGNTSGNSPWIPNLQHSSNESNPWLQLDLGADYSIDNLNIFNRSDALQSRLNNFYVFVSDTHFTTSASLDDLRNDTNVFEYFFTGDAGLQEILTLNTEGRYIRIQLSGNGILHLAEVEVIGCFLQASPCDGVALPTIAPAGPYVDTDAVQTLVGSPAGGVWSGASSDGTFDPSIGADTYTVTYTYDNGLGCMQSATQEIVVNTVGTGGCILSNVALTATATQSSTYGNGAASFAIDGNTSGNSPWIPNLQHSSNESNPWLQLDLGADYSIDNLNIFNRSDALQSRLNNFYVFVSDTPFATSASLDDLRNDTNVFEYFFTGDAGLQEILTLNTEGRYIRIQLSGNGILHLAEVEVMACLNEGAGVLGLRAYLEPTATLNLFPVPASNVLNVEYFLTNDSDNLIELNIFDNIGRQVINRFYDQDTFNGQVNVSQLQAGVYLIRIVKDDEILTKRFTINR